MKLIFRLLLAVTVLSLPLSAQTPTKPDNTKVNQRDRDSAKPTADQQKGRTDTEITRDIRRAIVADKGLSTYAHNVKIITKKGIVTLRGPVRSAEEKATVEAKAAEVAGKEKVKSEVQIATDKKKN